MINPFAHNKPGDLRDGETVVIKKIYPEGVLLEKSYDVTTLEDMMVGMKRMRQELFYVGKKRK